MKLLILVLTLVGVAALVGALGLLSSQPAYIAPELQKLSPEDTHRAIVVLSFLYALSALVAALAAWRRSPIALGAYAAFVGSALAFVTFLLYIAPIPKDAFFFVVSPIFLGVVGWGFWKGWATLTVELRRVRRVA
jgi:hypothetical protein